MIFSIFSPKINKSLRKDAADESRDSDVTFPATSGCGTPAAPAASAPVSMVPAPVISRAGTYTPPHFETWLKIWMFPKIGGKPPKWMVYFMENPIKHGMIWGTIILGNTHLLQMILFLAFFLSNHGVDYGKRPDKTNTQKPLFSFFLFSPSCTEMGHFMEFGGFDAFPPVIMVQH